MRRLAPLLLVAATGCATAKLVGERPVVPPGAPAPRTVVLEPLFESAEWQKTTTTEYAQVQTYDPRFGLINTPANRTPATVAITREVQEKPLFARVPTLVEVHRQLLLAVQALRPQWRVTSTGGVPVLTGGATVVRTVIVNSELVESDRTLKNFVFAVGLVIWPLQLWAARPVREGQLVTGVLERVDADAGGLKGRLVRYPTQPDYAVNLSGYPVLRRGFGLEVTYEEGLLADESPRTGVLISGFVDRLAAAVVAIVEESPAAPPAAPAPPPP